MVRHRREPEQDLDVTEYEVPSEPEAGAVAAPTPLASPVDTHSANVVSATGSKQSALGSAKQTFFGSPMAPSDKVAFAAAAKSADIAFHQSVIASALANSQPFPSGSQAVLRGFGVAA
jgi:hypothetical protein